MTGLFDSHAHYDHEQFDSDRGDLLKSLPEKGVLGVLNAASTLETSRAALSLADLYGFVWASAGIHPTMPTC
jgi:TatD DNase family protein